VDECLGSDVEMLAQLERLIMSGYTMVQLRAKSLNEDQFKVLAKKALALCEKKAVTLFVNTSLQCAIELNAKAVHLSGYEFVNTDMSLAGNMLVAVSCHTQDELHKAASLGALFAVLSPVCKSKTHPDVEPLGWAGFSQQLIDAPLPVYALGGLGVESLATALSSGAQGVAGIRGFIE